MTSIVRRSSRLVLATIAVCLALTAGLATTALAMPDRLGPHIIVHEGGANLHSSPGGEVILLLPQGEEFYVDASPEGVWCFGYGESLYWEENDATAKGWLLCGELDA